MIKVNFAGKEIIKGGYFAFPWWDVVWRRLKYKYNDDQLTAFLKLTDTLIRLELHEERLWKSGYAK